MTHPIPPLSESRSLRAVVFFALYAVEGIPSGFALTAVSNYLAAEGVGSEVIGAFAARIGLPWTVQFLWGPIIDRHQGSPMGRRRPWVVGSQFAAFVASLGVVAVRDPRNQLGMLSLAFLIHGIFASIQDASVDAMAIGMIPEEERGRVNAYMRAGLLFGSGAGAAAWAVLIRSAGFTAAAVAQSAVLLAMTVLTCFVRERPGDLLLPWGRPAADPVAGSATPDRPVAGRRPFATILAELVRGLLEPRGLRIFASTLAVYGAMAVFIRAFSYSLVGDLGWSDEDVSVYSGAYGTATGLAVSLAGAAIADRIGPRRLMIGSMGLIGGFLILFGASARSWANPPVAASGLILWSAFDPIFSIACMPVLMSLCRPGVEGSQFTAYMALVNLANAVGTYVSGQLQGRFSAGSLGLFAGLAIWAMLPSAIGSLRSAGSPREGSWS
ncbi:MFS transporter [Tundrisphaera sp. TA3]|uniref:MFS transporter n=1 Tax=Tundrisphaera sp. TA3 TaxID=3435775 RepID=UPI003EBF1A94